MLFIWFKSFLCLIVLNCDFIIWFYILFSMQWYVCFFGKLYSVILIDLLCEGKYDKNLFLDWFFLVLFQFYCYGVCVLGMVGSEKLEING